MKNLKQVLALGMAFSLTMSTMAGAAFTDQDSINKANTEAVDLLTNLSIIKGYEDGSFKPEGTVTRAEMAKMIYTIRNGGNDDASAYESVDTSFTDIKGHWAEGYIKYLQNTGIVAGKSATKFDPDATVTTAEAMKMALVLGGYRSDKANLTGAEWFNNTVSWATTNQLTDDVFSAMNGPCTRASAAQILANALEMTAVQWSEFVNGFVNDSKSGLAMGSDPITVGNKWMDLTVYVGQMTAAGDLEMTSSSSAGKDRFVVNVDTVDNKSVTSNKYETFKDGIDHTDLVGQEVKVLTGDKIDEVYGVYATGTSQVVETTMDKVTVDTANDKFEIGGTKYSVDDAKADVYADTNRSTVAAVFTSNGQAVSDKVKLVDSDNDGKYETVFVETVNVAQVTYVGTDSITIGAVGSRSNVLGTKKTIENSEMSIYEGAAKGDYVAITRDDYNKDNWKVEKATVVTGTVDGVVKNERKVRVDGTWYTLANTKSGSPAYTTLTVPNSIDEFTNKDEVTLYVVGDIVYYAEATRGNDANRPVAMVYDTKGGVGDWNSSNQAKVILADGTKKTVTVSGDSSVAFGSLEKGMIYEYTVNNDGDYLFTALSETNTAGYDFYDKDKDGLNGNDSYGSTNRVIADDAIVFAYIADKKDATVYTGKTVKNAQLGNGWGNKFDTSSSDAGVADFGVALAEKNNGFTYNRMISVAIKDTDKLNSTSNYGYLVTDGTYSYNKEQGAYVMEYSYWNGSEIVNVIEKTSTNKERWAVKGTVIAFSNDGEGLIKDVTNVATASGNDLLRYASMTGADTKGGYISVMNEDGTTNGSLEVTSDTIIYYVNSSAGTTDKIGVSSSGYDYAVDEVNGIRNVNVAYVKTPDNKVKFMVIDVNGKLAGHAGIAVSESENNISDALSKGDVTTAGNLTVDDGLQIPSNRTLTVNGNLTVEPNNARSVTGLVVEGSLVVTGELNVKANAVVSVIKGAAVSTNDMTVYEDSKVTVDAGTTVTVEGTYTGNEYVTGDGANGVIYKNEKDVKATKVSL